MFLAPTRFRGSWSELYRDHVEQNLPTAKEVENFHNWLLAYCQEPSAVFPVRSVRGIQRRQLYSTRDGTIIAPADNSPAWVVHALLVGGHLSSYRDFKAMMTGMPAHMFDVARVGVKTANSFGWYVAHICPAKNGDTRFHQWTRSEVERRCFLTLHPCNVFLVPGARNRIHGEDPRVIAFFAQRYAARYCSVWSEFLSLAQAVYSPTHQGFGDTIVEFDSPATWKRRASELEGRSGATEPSVGSPVAASYRATRLNFKRDVIEALSLDEQFEIVTPFGTYRFTKREFYAEFGNITQSISYREDGSYHGKNLHLKARAFRAAD